MYSGYIMIVDLDIFNFIHYFGEDGGWIDIEILERN